MSTRTSIPLTPTFLDGLLLLTNAVPDLVLVIDCANCGNDKFAMVGAEHDHMSSLTHWSRQHRAAFSDLKANDMVMGTEGRVRQKVASLIEAQHPSLLLLVQSSAVQLIGTDLQRLAEELQEETGVPIAMVPSQSMSGDWLDGFDAGLEVLARRIPWEPGPVDADAVGIVGHLLHRYEEDQRGNVRELARMIEALGLRVVSTWLDGSPTRSLGAMARAGTLVSLPSGRRTARFLGAKTGARVVAAGMPMGLDGTARWMRELGEALGRKDQAEALIDRELREIVTRLDKPVRRSFMHRKAAVVAPPHEAVELAGYLGELGMGVELVLVLTHRDAEGRRVQQELQDRGLEAEVLIDPSHVLAEQAFEAVRKGRGLELVVGSGAARDAAKPLGIPYVELGHPCYVRHALFDAPYMGFRGALWLADAMFNALNAWDYARF